jgi:hypothetical protein
MKVSGMAGWSCYQPAIFFRKNPGHTWSHLLEKVFGSGTDCLKEAHLSRFYKWQKK